MASSPSVQLRKAPEKKRRRAAPTRAQRDARAGLAMVSPTFVVILVMVILPVLWALILSFERIRLIQLQSVDLLAGPYTLRNYDLILGSEDFRSALITTLEYSVFGTTGAIVLGLIAALLVRRPFRGRGPRPRGDAAAVGGARGGHHVRVDRAAVAAARLRQRGRHGRPGLGRADPVPEPGVRERSRCSGSASACRPR